MPAPFRPTSARYGLQSIAVGPRIAEADTVDDEVHVAFRRRHAAGRKPLALREQGAKALADGATVLEMTIVVGEAVDRADQQLDVSHERHQTSDRDLAAHDQLAAVPDTEDSTEELAQPQDGLDHGAPGARPDLYLDDLPAQLFQPQELLALVAERLNRSHARHGLVKPARQSGTKRLDGLAQARQGAAEVASGGGGNCQEDHDGDRQPEIRDGHHRQHAADEDDVEGQVAHQLPDARLEHTDVAGRSVQQLARPMPLEEGQGLIQDMGMKVPPELVGRGGQKAGFDGQRQCMAQPEQYDHPDHGQSDLVQRPPGWFTEDRVNALLEQPRERHVGGSGSRRRRE